ncbi:MAG: hypothetical protein PVG07_03405 [Acidobacteriota bacterium]|jgi:hypothetical protein
MTKRLHHLAHYLGWSAALLALLAATAGTPLAAADVPGCSVSFSSSTVDGSSLWTDLQPKDGTERNCNFHNFIYNNFLYLVADDGNGHPRFMSLAPWYQLLPKSGEPTWEGSYQPFRPIEIVKSNSRQFGGEAGDNFRLLDVNSNATGYDIRVNKPFLDYVKNKDLYTSTGQKAAAAAFQSNPPDGGTWLPWGSDSEVGAIEIKTAWRDYGTNEDACPSDIMHCEEATDGHYWGFVAMHLVQKTPTRGELVWGSFEHVANSPDCNPSVGISGQTYDASNPIQENPKDPVTGGTISQGWNYFDYSSYQNAGGDGTTCTFPDDSSQPASDAQCNADPVSGYDKNGDPTFQRIDACRTDVLPAVSASDCETNIRNALNVSCLNRSVLVNFPGGLDSKWKYYQLIGAEWMSAASVPTTGCFSYNGGPHCPQGGSAPHFDRAGTTELANTTMETWMQKSMAGKYKSTEQGGHSQPVNATDCFSCHMPETTSWGEGDTSHVFTRIQQ